MFIEPCCIHNQLPPIVSKTFGHFNSNGDWGVCKLLTSIAYLVPSADYTIAMPSVDTVTLREFRKFLSHGWMHSLSLLTTSDQSDIIRPELSSFGSRLTYACSGSFVRGGMLVMSPTEKSDTDKTLIIDGPMLTSSTFELCTYNSYFGTDKEYIKVFTEAIMPRIRVSRKKSEVKSQGKLL